MGDSAGERVRFSFSESCAAASRRCLGCNFAGLLVFERGNRIGYLGISFTKYFAVATFLSLPYICHRASVTYENYLSFPLFAEVSHILNIHWRFLTIP